MDSQVVDAIKAAGKPFVPIVGADLGAFVDQLLNDPATGPRGRARDQPAAVGGAGVNLALKLLNGETVDRPDRRGARSRTSSCEAGPSPTTPTEEGKAMLRVVARRRARPALAARLHIEGWTDYTPEQAVACKGPGE